MQRGEQRGGDGKSKPRGRRPEHPTEYQGSEEQLLEYRAEHKDTKRSSDGPAHRKVARQRLEPVSHSEADGVRG